MSTLDTDNGDATTTVSDRFAHDVAVEGPVYGPFLPLLLLAVSLAGSFGFQSYEMWKERDALATTFAAQEKPLAESQKMRESLDKIAREVALLADKGNPSAKLVVDELRRRGITIDPKAQPTAPAK
jgi:hypothetical protein